MNTMIDSGPIQSYLANLTQQYGSGIECPAFVLRHGLPWQPAASPPTIRRGTPKECYSNAAKLAFCRPDLIYIEGFARWLNGPSIPFEHAWCCDSLGNVVDPTWTSGNEYFGVPFRTDFVREFIQKKQSWTVIDYPYMPDLSALPPSQFLHPCYNNQNVNTL